MRNIETRVSRMQTTGQFTAPVSAETFNTQPDLNNVLSLDYDSRDATVRELVGSYLKSIGREEDFGLKLMHEHYQISPQEVNVQHFDGEKYTISPESHHSNLTPCSWLQTETGIEANLYSKGALTSYSAEDDAVIKHIFVLLAQAGALDRFNPVKVWNKTLEVAPGFALFESSHPQRDRTLVIEVIPNILEENETAYPTAMYFGSKIANQCMMCVFAGDEKGNQVHTGNTVPHKKKKK